MRGKAEKRRKRGEERKKGEGKREKREISTLENVCLHRETGI
jgi:hypothetical protein